MKERFKSYSAVMLMLIRNTEKGEEILFQKRKNTGYCDGQYDVTASGHVEEGETMTEAMCREAKEEVSIGIEPEGLEFVCLNHSNYNNGTYYNGYFIARKWEGMPSIGEPEKIEELKWVNINQLPENIMEDRKIAIENYKNGVKYSETGW